jgi:hypothetical protein
MFMNVIVIKYAALLLSSTDLKKIDSVARSVPAFRVSFQVLSAMPYQLFCVQLHVKI